EQLVAEFESLGQDPKKVHLNVTEYYIHVAHARVNQCLRAGATGWNAHLPSLERAARDLRAAAKIPLIEAHAKVIEGYVSWFHGRGAEALAAYADAEALARAE